ncbi:TRNA_processing endoribonuclease Trz1 [Hexamita inflata]|uniref:ribonuclease Z n=1 Tax=Hexamita inflata TaxID=28002 RepID=A0AA86Q3A6_9EUKA|nr:TRNA processing endoribonuclease Trz1 [Hexamita inflata]
MCQVYSVVPPSLYPASFVIKVNQSSIIVNAAGGFQRSLNANQVPLGQIELIILTECTAEAVEGLLGFLMTRCQCAEMTRAKIIVPEDFEILHHLNEFALDPIYEGEMIICKERVITCMKDYNAEVVNVNGKLQFKISPNLELTQFDQEKLVPLKLTGKQIGQLRAAGSLQLADGTTVSMQDMSVQLKCGEILYGDHFTPLIPNSLIISDSPLQNTTSDTKTMILQDSGYPINDFILFYNEQGTSFSHTSQTGQKFVMFPPKLFGFESQLVDKKPKQFEKLNKRFVNQNAYKDYIEFFGTGASVPNKYNNVSAAILKLNQQQVLIDCGEATYQQITFSQNKTELEENMIVVITHEHADHYLGLGTLFNVYYKKFNKYPRLICQDLVLQYLQYVGIKTESEINLNLINEENSKCVQINTIEMQIFKSQHCDHSMHYLFSDETREIIFTGDGRPFEYAFKNQEKKKTLIHETTFTDEQKEAEDRMHSTVNEAIEVSKRIKADKLIITHFSQRHSKEALITEEMDSEHLTQAFDFMVVGI